jgi:hypothetical protein
VKVVPKCKIDFKIKPVYNKNRAKILGKFVWIKRKSNQTILFVFNCSLSPRGKHESIYITKAWNDYKNF